ncbi:hypothetical protein RV15_GL001551 [Enterococcus silesiacus]|uniref:J domain-containing protein n=1 Tax=Enterococcus silesiacus TaxID=332949 RepID=A0AA91JNM6_9ENTE|nr:hypothetical protein RV15_GL001551 [Enterococcus silesiacus]
MGLEPTSDKKKVKQAYAAKLKTINVDEEPLAFQKLKEAFDSAIFLTGTIIESNRPTESISSLEEKVQEDELQAVFVENETVEPESKPQDDLVQEEAIADNESTQVQKTQQGNAVEIFNQELAAIYEGMAFFSDVEKWTLLFSNELEWSIDEHNEIKHVMQHFLLTNYRVLSRTIIDYIGSIFDFDALVKDYRSGDYFCYTWTEIKNVPNFFFDHYSEIPKEERLTYFTNRYNLFQLLEDSIPDQTTWIESLDLCRMLTTNDVDVVNLQISFLLLTDFRMEQEATINHFTTLLETAKSLRANRTSEFFSIYYEWIKNEGSANAVLIFDKSEIAIPTVTINLLMGYVYFRLNRHSSVKEYWGGLAKKVPSLFRADELAMLDLMETVTVPQKKKKSAGQYVWLIFVLIIAFVKIGGVISRSNERNTSIETSDIQNMFSEERELYKNVINKLSDLKESDNLYDQFLYYFYIDREDEDRVNFIEQNLVGQAKEMAENITISQLPEVTIESRYDFQASPDNVSDYGFVTALTLLEDDDPFIILQEDEDDRISNVFGEGWEVLPEDQFDALWANIQVRPMMSQKFFVVYYLLSDERKENLKANPEYSTENIKKLLEKNSSMAIAEEFESGTWQISQDEENKLYTIINDENGEHQFILSYDDYGRLEHIYGDKWEKLDDEKRKLIHANAEEKIDVY